MNTTNFVQHDAKVGLLATHYFGLPGVLTNVSQPVCLDPKTVLPVSNTLQAAMSIYKRSVHTQRHLP
jgi:hypothetical protein